MMADEPDSAPERRGRPPRAASFQQPLVDPLPHVYQRDSENGSDPNWSPSSSSGRISKQTASEIQSAEVIVTTDQTSESDQIVDIETSKNSYFRLN